MRHLLNLLVIAIVAVVALNRARWIRRYQVRVWFEVVALLAPGLAVMGAWASSRGVGQIGTTLTVSATLVAAAACVIVRVPAWPGKRVGATIHKERAGLRDLLEIVQLVQLSFGRLPISPALMVWWVLRGGCYIERSEAGQVAGFVATFPLRRGNTWVELIAVHPDHRRRGVGSRLLDGMGTMCLIARESNIGALAFYRRADFEVLDVWSGYYRGESAIVHRME